MMFGFNRQESVLGIDISTSSVKIVELKHLQGGFELLNYGELKNYGYVKRLNNAIQTSSFKMFDEEVAVLIKKVLKAAEIKNKEVVFSIPIFSTFITAVEMKGLEEREIASAIKFEARRYVPVPLSEVVLNWMIIGKEINENKEKQVNQNQKTSHRKSVKILLVAVPKKVIDEYGQIADAANLSVKILESESFSLVRSLVSAKDKEGLAVVDIGARSTNIVLVKNGIIRLAHNIDISGGEITDVLSRNLNIDYARAERLKKKQGLNLSGGEGEISSIVLPVVNKISFELERLFKDFYNKEGMLITKIILSGGSANMPGLANYFNRYLNIKVELGNAFKNIAYPPKLESFIKEISPAFAVAIGAAMRRG